jgi:hypothetical protein
VLSRPLFSDTYVSYVRCGTRYGWVYVVAGVQTTVDGVARAPCAAASIAAAASALTAVFIEMSSGKVGE